MDKLSKYQKNLYSQNGEDGIILEVLSRLGRLKDSNSGTNWCVEFGAWDGIRGSNTYNLIENHNYISVQIEPDKKKFKELEKNLDPTKHVLINSFVEIDGKYSLDQILHRASIPINFDLLSIDVDGMDYHIWEATRNFRPKVVCIEFNPTIPGHVDFIQERNFKVSQGSSLKSVIELAKTKKYTLVAITHCNLIFVCSEDASKVIGDLESQEIVGSHESIFKPNFLFLGYDGSVHLTQKVLFPWHEIEIDENELQFLPKIIRSYPPNYSFLQRLLFLLFRLNRMRFRGGFIHIVSIFQRILKLN
jgi:hypothetical protein